MDEAIANHPAEKEPWLPPALVASWPEIIIVIALIIGHSMAASNWQAWHGSSRTYIASLVTDQRLLRTITMEGPILGLLFLYLNRRGWKPADLRIKPGWRSSGQGLLLIPAMGLANSITVAMAYGILFSVQTQYQRFLPFLVSMTDHLKPHSVHVSWLAVIAAMVLNAFYEEITCMAYTFNQFAAKRGPLIALIVTVLLRMSCHTYQGPVHALGIGAVFTVSGVLYWWTRNLWPLIFAHAIVDTLSFAAIKFLYG